MHIVRFMEGFANQLFQLCFYRKLEEAYGPGSVFADCSFYDTNPIHGGFKLKPLYPLRYIHDLPDDLMKINEISYFTTAFDGESNYYYIGYWQDDERFFPEDMGFIDDLFRSDLLSPENRETLLQIDSVNSVSVHVRRGDYLDNDRLGNISTPGYYANAIAHIQETEENPVFFVFSNDLSWCRQNLDFGGSRSVFVSGNDEHVELDILMMSRCRHNIISNSSFSWWAQYMNRNPDKTVISPEYWYNPGIDISPSTDRLNKSSFLHVKSYATVKQSAADPFFSILIPVRNQKNGLIRCLTSVLNQPFDNIEIILIDDASDDGSRDVETEYAAADARIVLKQHEVKESFFVSRILAIRRARGRYLLFADADDYLSWDACRTLYKNLTEAPTEILSFSWRTDFYGKRLSADPENLSQTLIKALTGKPGGALWNMCWSRELAVRALDAVDPVYCDIREDGILAPLLLLHATELRYTEHTAYFRVSGDTEFSPDSFRDNFPQAKMDSLQHKSRLLTHYFAEYAPDLLPCIQKQEAAEVSALVRRGLAAYRDRSVFSKMVFLRSIDKRFGTNYLSGTIRKRLRRVIRPNKSKRQKRKQ